MIVKSNMENHNYEQKTKWVVFLTAVTMVVEIFYGLSTGSMALLADGIHMGSHVLAIGLSWLAYIFVRKIERSKKLNAESDKVLSLSGFTSGLLLLIFSLAIMYEAISRLFHPIDIVYKDAILVAVIGLIVNIVSAIILHHDHEHSDNNIKAAYLHVLADSLTSVSAIVGLTVALVWGIPFLDIIAAFISSLVIIRWSIGLLIDSGRDLLNFRKIQD